MFKFKGCQSFRLRLVCATLAGKSIRIDDIRAQDEQPGLRDFEASFLRLLEKVTNGCTVEINETGTTARPRLGWRPQWGCRRACLYSRRHGPPAPAWGASAHAGCNVITSFDTTFFNPAPCSTGTSLRYRPGVITGGSLLQHDCPTTRSIGYFLEPLVVLALYGKKVSYISPCFRDHAARLASGLVVVGVGFWSAHSARRCMQRSASNPHAPAPSVSCYRRHRRHMQQPLSITLRGVTNDSLDPGVDTFRTVTLPLLKRLGVEDAGLELRIVRRGAPPLGGGEVQVRPNAPSSLLRSSLSSLLS